MNRQALTASIAVAVVLGMMGLAFASKPLYDTFCRVTGFGGTTQIASGAPTGPIDRNISVRFDSNVSGLPLRFSAEAPRIDTQVGATTLAFFKVTNTSDRPITAMASYNVTPYKMGPYFSKLECFCFDERVFEAGETVELPVVFFVDPAMDKERSLRDVGTVTLSYTFYPGSGEPPVPQAAAANTTIAGGGGK